MSMRRMRTAVIVLAAGYALAPAALGASYLWNNAGGGNWSSAGNWSPAGGPPVAGDLTTFNVGATFDVNISNNAASHVNVLSGVVTFKRTGAIGFLDLRSGAGEIAVQGTCQLNAGADGAPVAIQAANLFRIQSGAGAVIQHGSIIEADRLLLSGAGGAVNSSLIISGASSRLLIGTGTSPPASLIGDFGARGVLSISAGGRASFVAPLLLAESSANNSRGTVNVLGGSTLTTSHLIVGNSMSSTATGQIASVVVQGAGAVATQTGAANLTIGSAVNSNIDAHVSLSGGGLFNSGTGQTLVRNSGRLNVGGGSTFNANGSLVVDRGGAIDVAGAGAMLRAGTSPGAAQNFIGLGAGDSRLTVRQGAIASFAGPLHLSRTTATGAHSRIDVLADSILSAGDLTIGNHPQSMNLIQNFARLNVTGSGALASQVGAAELTIGGPSPHSSAHLNVTGGGVFSSGTGLLRVLNQGFVEVGPNSRFKVNGDMDIDRGKVTVNTPDAFEVAPGRSVTVRNDGVLSLNRHGLVGGSTFTVNSGGQINFSGPTLIGIPAGAADDARLIVAGVNSATSFDAFSLWGPLVTVPARVTVQNSATLHTKAVALSTGFLDPQQGGVSDVQILSGGAMITDGALTMAISEAASAHATLTVDGGNSRFMQTSDNAVAVGHSAGGSAVVNVRNNARFTSGGGGVVVGATGRVNLESGVFHARGPIEMQGGQFNFLGGRLHVQTFQGNLLNQGGVLAPRAPGGLPGFTTVSGDYTQQPAGTLEIELGGLVPGIHHGRLDVVGAAALAGTLHIELINAFVPQAGHSFNIINASNIAGRFDTILGREVNPTTWLATMYEPTRVTLAVARPGDANLDGAVNLADFNILAANFGASNANWLTADFTGDGLVNLADFNALAANFGLSAGPDGPTPHDWSALGSAVPEPALLTLSGVAALAAMLRPRRRQRGEAHQPVPAAIQKEAFLW